MYCSASVISATKLLTRRHLPTAASAVWPVVHRVALRPSAAALQGHQAVLNKIARWVQIYKNIHDLIYYLASEAVGMKIFIKCCKSLYSFIPMFWHNRFSGTT